MPCYKAVCTLNAKCQHGIFDHITEWPMVAQHPALLPKVSAKRCVQFILHSYQQGPLLHRGSLAFCTIPIV